VGSELRERGLIVSCIGSSGTSCSNNGYRSITTVPAWRVWGKVDSLNLIMPHPWSGETL